MHGTDDQLKREYHQELILDYLRETFPDAQVSQQPGGPHLVETFLVDLDDPRRLYRLAVPRAILEDSHQDHEITDALRRWATAGGFESADGGCVRLSCVDGVIVGGV